jgi:proteic killer suppression protein
MDILVRDRKLRTALEDEAECRRRFGKDMAKKLQVRLTALIAAESLAVFWPPLSGPERCHELKGDLAGVFSVDVKQPYRLLFRPVEDPTAEHSDQRERWQGVKSVEIVGIKDTHG